MNLKCFFGHNWHNVSNVTIKANGYISLSGYYPLLGDSFYSDRICKRCDKVEFNKELALKELSRMKEEKRVIAKRFENLRRLKNKGTI